MNKEKEEKLREAAITFDNKLKAHPLSSEELINTLIEFSKSNDVSEYHTPTVDLTELRKLWDETSDYIKTKNVSTDGIWNFFLSHIQPKHDKESDAVEFAEWLRVECNCFDSSPNWYYLNNGESSPKTSKELYDIFTNSKTNNK